MQSLAMRYLNIVPVQLLVVAEIFGSIEAGAIYTTEATDHN